MAKKDKRRLVEKLHEALNDIVSKQLVTDDFGYVRFERRGDTIISQGTREALNRSDTVKTYVTATHWFNVFWFYVNVTVRKGEDGVSELPFVSVSFFQEIDGDLKQQFRAEWDNYRDLSHPQPHWHITSNKDDSFDDFNQQDDVDDDNPFAELVESGNKLEVSSKLDLPSIHFAMAGNWHEGKKTDMITGYTEAQKMANWLNNLFDHVQEELVYASHL
jgi:hypothetical protein